MRSPNALPLCSGIFLAFLLVCRPGTTAPAQDRNIVANGGFEQTAAAGNIWDGVDAGGFLAGNRDSVSALLESGGIGNLAMPVSVKFTDLSGDGLPDLMMADPAGCFRIFFNSGTKREPKFTQCEIVPIFLSKGTSDLWYRSENELSRAPKIDLADWSGRGLQDLVIGNYAGQILLLPNTGTVAKPEWRQPDHPNDLLIKTAKDGELWGNLFAPAVFDWNGDGKLDLLIGEGSYSANAIHLLLGKGGGGRPDFGDQIRYYLAYGDGREQLVPTVADFNGDGLPDVLAGDRKGQVAVHLRKPGWKPGDETPFATFISFGTSSRIKGGCIAPCTAGWNGDGLFDLIIGETNGRVAVAINRGTKENPKFDAPFEVKGEDLRKQSIQIPNDWDLDTGLRKGNFYAYGSAVNADEDSAASPTEGSRCLKVAYWPSPNRILPKPELDLPVFGTLRTFRSASSTGMDSDGNSRARMRPLKSHRPPKS